MNCRPLDSKTAYLTARPRPLRFVTADTDIDTDPDTDKDTAEGRRQQMELFQIALPTLQYTSLTHALTSLEKHFPLWRPAPASSNDALTELRLATIKSQGTGRVPQLEI